jgi:hypothetical protein
MKAQLFLNREKDCRSGIKQNLFKYLNIKLNQFASYEAALKIKVFFIFIFSLADSFTYSWRVQSCKLAPKQCIARIHSQFESLGFVGKYDQSPTNIVNS